MFQSILGKLHISVQSKPSSTVSSSAGDFHSDKEEDGFLVVGETTNERSIVTHREFMSIQGTSPAYNTAMQAPPTYQAAANTNFTTPNPSDMSSNPLLALADVPFQLSPHLSLLNNLRAFDYLHNIPTHFDYFKYDYDFQFEQRYLKEFGGTPR